MGRVGVARLLEHLGHLLIVLVPWSVAVFPVVFDRVAFGHHGSDTGRTIVLLAFQLLPLPVGLGLLTTRSDRSPKWARNAQNGLAASYLGLSMLAVAGWMIDREATESFFMLCALHSLLALPLLWPVLSVARCVRAVRDRPRTVWVIVLTMQIVLSPIVVGAIWGRLEATPFLYLLLLYLLLPAIGSVVEGGAVAAA